MIEIEHEINKNYEKSIELGRKRFFSKIKLTKPIIIKINKENYCIMTMFTDFEGYKKPKTEEIILDLNYQNNKYNQNKEKRKIKYCSHILPEGRFFWVTATPELKLNIINIKCYNGRKQRAIEILGLNPKLSKPNQMFMVNMLVPISKIKRPSIKNFTSLIKADKNNIKKTNKSWTLNEFEQRYKSDHPFPFTGMGYTWDWGKMKPGIAEYIIEGGTKILVI